HRLEVAANLRDHALDTEAAELVRRLLFLQELVAELLPQLLREVDDVLAGVAVLRDLGVDAVKLLVAGEERAGEVVDLRELVVDQVLLLGMIARGCEDARQRVANGGPAAVADVQRAG